MVNLAKPTMFIEAEKSRGPKNIVLQLLIFYLVFIISGTLQAIPQMIVIGKDLVGYIIKTDYLTTVSDAEYMDFVNSLAMKNFDILLYSTIFGTICAIIYCRFIEKRSLSSMGIVKEKCISKYIVGAMVGLAMILATALLTFITNGIYLTINENLNYLILLMYLGGFIIQGMSEEFIFRGYLMNSIAGKHSIILAVIISSLAFSLAHGLNANVTILALLNIFLFGVFMALYMICFNDIWGASAIHSIWNFVQGNVLGISVSGNNSVVSVLSCETNSKVSALLSGGDFGIEGSIFCTIVLITSGVLLLIYMKKVGKLTLS